MHHLRCPTCYKGIHPKSSAHSRFRRAQVLGSIDGSGRIRLVDPEAPPGTPTPVDLDLETVLGSMPNKTFRFDRKPLDLRPLALPQVRLWSSAGPCITC